jgi:hypothetical protein
MIQVKTIQSIHTKAIILIMGLLFIALQIDFHPTYLQYFPKFEQFNWVHHTHVTLMVSWMLILFLSQKPIFKK